MPKSTYFIHFSNLCNEGAAICRLPMLWARGERGTGALRLVLACGFCKWHSLRYAASMSVRTVTISLNFGLQTVANILTATQWRRQLSHLLVLVWVFKHVALPVSAFHSGEAKKTKYKQMPVLIKSLPYRCTDCHRLRNTAVSSKQNQGHVGRQL